MNKMKGIEIKIVGCVVCNCKKDVAALIVASNDSESLRFPVCERHSNGLYGAVLTKFAPQDYLVFRYTKIIE